MEVKCSCQAYTNVEQREQVGVQPPHETVSSGEVGRSGDSWLVESNRKDCGRSELSAKVTGCQQKCLDAYSKEEMGSKHAVKQAHKDRRREWRARRRGIGIRARCMRAEILVMPTFEWSLEVLAAQCTLEAWPHWIDSLQRVKEPFRLSL